MFEPIYWVYFIHMVKPNPKYKIFIFIPNIQNILRNQMKVLLFIVSGMSMSFPTVNPKVEKIRSTYYLGWQV